MERRPFRVQNRRPARRHVVRSARLDPYIPKGVVVDTSFDWEGDRLLDIPWNETIIYELHVKGFTKSNKAVDPSASVAASAPEARAEPELLGRAVEREICRCGQFQDYELVPDIRARQRRLPVDVMTIASQCRCLGASSHTPASSHPSWHATPIVTLSRGSSVAIFRSRCGVLPPKDPFVHRSQ